MDDDAVIERQLGRPPRGVAGVAARCPYGAPGGRRAGLPTCADGEPFPTTYYLTCPHAVAAVSALEDAGGVERYQRLVERRTPCSAESYASARSRQRELRRPAAGHARRRRARSRWASAAPPATVPSSACTPTRRSPWPQPGYLLGRRGSLDEAAPLFPADAVLQRVSAPVELAMMEWDAGRAARRALDVPPQAAKPSTARWSTRSWTS